MTPAEQAERTARNTLELNRLRRKVAACYSLAARWRLAQQSAQNAARESKLIGESLVLDEQARLFGEAAVLLKQALAEQPLPVVTVEP